MSEKLTKQDLENISAMASWIIVAKVHAAESQNQVPMITPDEIEASLHLSERFIRADKKYRRRIEAGDE